MKAAKREVMWLDEFQDRNMQLPSLQDYKLDQTHLKKDTEH